MPIVMVGDTHTSCQTPQVERTYRNPFLHRGLCMSGRRKGIMRRMSIVIEIERRK
jgi:hypothetical protein